MSAETLANLPLWRLLVALADAERTLGPADQTTRDIARAVRERLGQKDIHLSIDAPNGQGGDPVAADAYLRPRDVAETLDVKVSVVLHWLHTRELGGINVAQVAGKRPRWRIAEQDLQRFIERRTAATAPPRQRRRRQPAEPEVIAFFKNGKRQEVG